MKKKAKITFELDCEYSPAKKYLKRMSRDFDNWLKEWALYVAEEHNVTPYIGHPSKRNGFIEMARNHKVKIKIIRDKEEILNKQILIKDKVE